MTGERDLNKLLQHMTPQLQPGTFVFCTFPSGELLAGLTPIATFREAERLTAIVTLDEAERAGMQGQRLCCRSIPMRSVDLTRP